jgi:hypothetical protein
MNNSNETHEDKGFLLQLYMRAEQKAKEYQELIHERQRLEMRIERTKEYVEQLNKFLIAEGQQPITIKTLPHIGSAVGKPGNRSKSFPLRQIKWEGMSINQIIENILNTSPTVIFHPKEIASIIYEIKSESDLRLVLRNIRSTMQRGAREGLWEKTGRAMFKAKMNEKQGVFANT